MSEIDRSNEPDALELELPTNELFDLLADSRRRDALRYLLDRQEEATLEELLAEIASDEERQSDRRLERLSTELHHVHLPKLSEAGVVRYDHGSGSVAPISTTEGLEPLLDRLATHED